MNCGLCFVNSGFPDRSFCCSIRRRRLRLSCLIYAMVFAGTVSPPKAMPQEDNPVISITSRQQPSKGQTRSKTASIHADVKLVLVPVTVTDLLERPVLGLNQKNF